MQRITYTQGNTFSVSVPMQKKMVEKVDNVTTITTEDFIPEEGDIIEVRLIGERRQYRYTPTIEGNVAVFVCAGNELAGRYGIEVNVLCANGERMRFADPHAIELVPFTGIMDNFVVGSVELGASVFFAMRGEKGDKGNPGEDGVGIASITKVSTQGLVDTYAITYTDGTSTTFQVTNGAKGDTGATGATGADGRGIVGIAKTASHGLIDTYTIEYTDRTTSTYQVTNGANGANGKGISSITKTGTSGLVDTYTITYTDGTTSTYQVTNGEDGQDAQEDLMITATKMTGANTYYDLDYTWQELKARLNDDLGGGNMFVQLQLPNNDWIKLPFIVFDTDDMLHFGAEYREPISGVVANYDLFYGDDGFAELTTTPLQDALVSGTNIKTINNTSMLGSGNIAIPAGKSAYQSYVETTTDVPVKTEAEWVASLKGADGVDLGEAVLINDLTTGGATNVLSAEMGKVLNNTKPTIGEGSEDADLEVVDEDGYILARFEDGNFEVKNFHSAAVSVLLNKYKGKKISILGDSISTFGDPTSTNQNGTYCWSYYPTATCRYSLNGGGDGGSIQFNVNDTYWMRLINRLGSTLGINESYRGTLVTGSDSTAFNNQTRIDHLGNNGTPDLILVFGGTNDAGNSATIGTFSGGVYSDYDTAAKIAALDVSTFANAYKAMLIRLMYTYPTSEIVCILPTFTTSYYTIQALDDYVEIIKEACDFFGIKWIDVRVSDINIFNKATYLVDGIHPNAQGMQLLANKIYKHLIFD